MMPVDPVLDIDEKLKDFPGLIRAAEISGNSAAVLHLLQPQMNLKWAQAAIKDAQG